MYEEYCSKELWRVPMAPPVNSRLWLVKAARSDQWVGAAGEKLQEVGVLEKQWRYG